MTKITQAERQAWLMRKDTIVVRLIDKPSRKWVAQGFVDLGGYGRTKFAAIDAAIRAERKAKGDR